MPIAPSGFDQDTSRPAIAGLGDAAAVDRVSCGAFGGYETAQQAAMPVIGPAPIE